MGDLREPHESIDQDPYKMTLKVTTLALFRNDPEWLNNGILKSILA